MRLHLYIKTNIQIEQTLKNIVDKEERKMTRKRSVTTKALLAVNAHVSMIILNRHAHAQICVQEAYDEAQMLLCKNISRHICPVAISHYYKPHHKKTCNLHMRFTRAEITMRCQGSIMTLSEIMVVDGRCSYLKIGLTYTCKARLSVCLSSDTESINF